MERKFNLPQTRGEFKLKGIVNGVERNNFFEEGKTQNGNDKKTVRFGVKTSNDNNVQVKINGYEKEKVFFYKRPAEGEKKGDTQKVAWAERNVWKEEGYRLIGLNVGITQFLDKEGKMKNDNKTMTEFDACKYIKEHLEDDRSIFVKGNISYSSFKNDKGDVRRSVNYDPNQISLSSSPVDFDSEKFEEENSFKQTIIFMGIEMDETDKEDKKGVVSAKIVTYNSIETVEFIVRQKGLFKTLKKKVKPYTSLLVWGVILNKAVKEEIVAEDEWGEANTFDKPKNTYIREMEIKGVDPNSIDTETYSEEKIDEALRALREFGESENSKDENKGSDDWGSENKQNDEEDEW